MTETSTRHSLLTKQKHFRDRGKKDLISNSNKLTGATNDTPIDVDNGPMMIREESDEQETGLADIPVAEDDEGSESSLFVGSNEEYRTKRQRVTFEAAESPQESFSPGLEPLAKRHKEDTPLAVAAEDDKKKLAMDTTYDGFAIYGRVLCLVVKRKDIGKGKGSTVSAGQAMMEDWITSTQMPPHEDAS